MIFLIKLFLVIKFIFLEIKKLKSFFVYKFMEFKQFKFMSIIKKVLGMGNFSFKDDNLNKNFIISNLQN